MGIVNGDLIDADELMNSFGSNLNDTAQMIFNADYLGFDSRLANSGSPVLRNLFYSTFTSDDADDVQGFLYDAINNLYKTIPIGSGYVIIEASSYNGSWVDGNNNVSVARFGSGKWIVASSSINAEISRAEVMQSLFFGTNATDQIALDFTTITAIKTIDTRDIGKQATYSEVSGNPAPSLIRSGTYTNTTTNTDCSSWSSCFGPVSGAVNNTASWSNGGITLNISNDNTVHDEMGTDLNADEQNNPANCSLNLAQNSSGSSNTFTKVIIIHEGSISWSGNGSDIDYLVDNSVPVFTLATESINESTLIFKDTATSSVDNAIVVINSQIDATSSEQISISANGGSNYTDVNNTEIARPTAGTELWRKIVITRTDLTKIDIVTEQLVKYNYY